MSGCPHLCCCLHIGCLYASEGCSPRPSIESDGTSNNFLLRKVNFIGSTNSYVNDHGPPHKFFPINSLRHKNKNITVELLVRDHERKNKKRTKKKRKEKKRKRSIEKNNSIFPGCAKNEMDDVIYPGCTSAKLVLNSRRCCSEDPRCSRITVSVFLKYLSNRATECQ